jgi:hypothetical protein
MAGLSISDYDYLQITGSDARLQSDNKGYLSFNSTSTNLYSYNKGYLSFDSTSTNLYSYNTLLLTGKGDLDSYNAAPVRIRAYSTTGSMKA